MPTDHTVEQPNGEICYWFTRYTYRLANGSLKDFEYQYVICPHGWRMNETCEPCQRSHVYRWYDPPKVVS